MLGIQLHKRTRPKSNDIVVQRSNLQKQTFSRELIANTVDMNIKKTHMLNSAHAAIHITQLACGVHVTYHIHPQNPWRWKHTLSQQLSAIGKNCGVDDMFVAFPQDSRCHWQEKAHTDCRCRRVILPEHEHSVSALPHSGWAGWWWLHQISIHARVYTRRALRGCHWQEECVCRQA